VADFKGARATRASSLLVVVIVPVVIIVVPIVIVIVIIVVVIIIIIIIVVVIVAIGPTFGLADLVEVHLVPGFEVDFLDLAVEILDLDQLGVLVHRQDAEGLLFLDVFVPLAGCGFVVSAHGEDPVVASE